MKLPRVTEILGPFCDFSMVPPAILQAACERGTAVHGSFADYASGFYSPVPEEHAGYFKSFRSWFDRYVVEVLAVEAEVVNEKWSYLGHVDLIARLSGLRDLPFVAVVDWKTPFSESRSWHAQTQAYVEAARPVYGELVGGALRLRKDGSPAIMSWVENPARSFNAFCGILNGWNYLKGGK